MNVFDKRGLAIPTSKRLIFRAHCPDQYKPTGTTMKLDPGLPGIRGATNHPTKCDVTSHKLSHLFTALLHDMQHVLSLESVNQPVNKSPEFNGTSKLHYRVYNSPKLVAILCHMNPTHAVPFRSLKTNYNATLQSASRTPPPQAVYLLRVSQPKP